MCHSTATDFFQNRLVGVTYRQLRYTSLRVTEHFENKNVQGVVLLFSYGLGNTTKAHTGKKPTTIV